MQKNFFKNISCLLFYALLCLTFSQQALARKNIEVKHGKSIDGFAQVQITNKTTENLACYVAIDGHKVPFILNALKVSKWYKATNRRYNYAHFSVWCDLLTLYPHYQR